MTFKMRIINAVLLFGFLVSKISGLNITSLGTVNACIGDDISFPWNFINGHALDVYHETFWTKIGFGGESDLVIMSTHGNMTLVDPDSRYQDRIERLEGTDVGVTISNATEEDAGTYRVDVTLLDDVVSEDNPTDLVDLHLFRSDQFKATLKVDGVIVAYDKQGTLINKTNGDTGMKLEVSTTPTNLTTTIQIDIHYADQKTIQCINQSTCTANILFSKVSTSNLLVIVKVDYSVCQKQQYVLNILVPQKYQESAAMTLNLATGIAIVLALALVIVVVLLIICVCWVRGQNKKRAQMDDCERCCIGNQCCNSTLGKLLQFDTIQDTAGSGTGAGQQPTAGPSTNPGAQGGVTGTKNSTMNSDTSGKRKSNDMPMSETSRKTDHDGRDEGENESAPLDPDNHGTADSKGKGKKSKGIETKQNIKLNKRKSESPKESPGSRKSADGSSSAEPNVDAPNNVLQNDGDQGSKEGASETTNEVPGAEKKGWLGSLKLW